MATKKSWDLVADLLRQARAERAPGLSRDAFAVKVGGSLRIMADLETAARGNYDRQTLINAETWYGLRPGQLDALLETGDLLEATQVQLMAAEGELASMAPAAAPNVVQGLTTKVDNARAQLATVEKRLDRLMAQRRRADREPVVVVPDRDDATHVLLDLPDEALEGLDEMEREEVRTAARLAALRKAREIRGGGQRGLFTME